MWRQTQCLYYAEMKIIVCVELKKGKTRERKNRKEGKREKYTGV